MSQPDDPATAGRTDLEHVLWLTAAATDLGYLALDASQASRAPLVRQYESEAALARQARAAQLDHTETGFRLETARPLPDNGERVTALEDTLAQTRVERDRRVEATGPLMRDFENRVEAADAVSPPDADGRAGDLFVLWEDAVRRAERTRHADPSPAAAGIGESEVALQRAELDNGVELEALRQQDVIGRGDLMYTRRRERDLRAVQDGLTAPRRKLAEARAEVESAQREAPAAAATATPGLEVAELAQQPMRNVARAQGPAPEAAAGGGGQAPVARARGSEPQGLTPGGPPEGPSAGGS